VQKQVYTGKPDNPFFLRKTIRDTLPYFFIPFYTLQAHPNSSLSYTAKYAAMMRMGIGGKVGRRIPPPFKRIADRADAPVIILYRTGDSFSFQRPRKRV
jgi:hypothetical protein